MLENRTDKEFYFQNEAQANKDIFFDYYSLISSHSDIYMTQDNFVYPPEPEETLEDLVDEVTGDIYFSPENLVKSPYVEIPIIPDKLENIYYSPEDVQSQSYQYILSTESLDPKISQLYFTQEMIDEVNRYSPQVTNNLTEEQQRTVSTPVPGHKNRVPPNTQLNTYTILGINLQNYTYKSQHNSEYNWHQNSEDPEDKSEHNSEHKAQQNSEHETQQQNSEYNWQQNPEANWQQNSEEDSGGNWQYQRHQRKKFLFLQKINRYYW